MFIVYCVSFDAMLAPGHLFCSPMLTKDLEQCLRCNK